MKNDKSFADAYTAFQTKNSFFMMLGWKFNITKIAKTSLPEEK